MAGTRESKALVAPAAVTDRPRARTRARTVAGWALAYLVMSALAVVFALPLVWMIGTSLKREAEVLSIPPTFFPSEAQWHNYATTFDTIKTFMWNSSYLAVLNVVGLLLVASLAAYGFARLEFAGRDLAFALLLSTAMIPGIIYLIPQYILYRNFGWIDTHYPLWVPRVLTPVIGTFLLRQFFKSLPQELEDAARLDGASTFRIYWNIMLPQVKPGLAAVGVFTFLESWNDLFGPLIFINSVERQTLPVALALYQGEFFTQTTLLMAGATITILPVILLFIGSQKYFIRGITMTGLKG
ncbi:MAG TPA: carbohydrate ABC transporter permease [bacterium]|jgi:ABC-type glycerol-3-phosphate transport system permease component|nr:carbohydrate ABC transporter permease [bacterium]